jgi:AraC-like DNA-binding protein
MLFVYRKPRPSLDPYVESVWVCRGSYPSSALERVLPTGGAQLTINLVEDEIRLYDRTERGIHCTAMPGTILTGITTRSQIIDTAEQEYVAGVVFRPGGTLPFFATPASEITNADVPLELMWGRTSVEQLREQLLAANAPDSALDVLEAGLLSAWRDRASHPAVAFALRSFRATPSLARLQTVTDAIGLSPKRFIERFKTEVGVTPKRYCRLLRFQRAVQLAYKHEVNWAQLAVDCGYFDQAHFIHEFRDFSGLTPGNYQTACTEFQNHVNFLQSP